MGGLGLVALLVACCIKINQSAVLDEDLQRQLRFLNRQITVLDRLLLSNCPSYIKSKRGETTDILQAKLDVRKLHYQLLERQYIECKIELEGRGNNSSFPSATGNVKTSTNEGAAE